jgi:cyclase
MGVPDHLVPAVLDAKADAIAMADILHYRRASIGEIRNTALAAGIPVRRFHEA